MEELIKNIASNILNDLEFCDCEGIPLFEFDAYSEFDNIIVTTDGGLTSVQLMDFLKIYTERILKHYGK